jgi:phosphoenolpyruvate phosphomutase
MTASSLRDLINQPGKLVKLAGAHDAIGVRLAQDAGFDAVWASSFEIATAHGVSDGSVLPSHCRRAIAGVMASAGAIPIVVDCETGPDDADELKDLVQYYEAVGVQAMCIEDAGHPRCSLLPGGHTLAPVEKFSAKIEAIRGLRRSKDFLVLARVQAFVANQSQAEALSRAQAYAACGADAIVIHSRSPDPGEVLAFATNWHQGTQLAIIPTTYHMVTEDQIRQTGKIKMVIYANYGLRAGIAAVRRVFHQILAEGTAQKAEKWVASLDEVFVLQHPRRYTDRPEKTP